MKWVVLLLLVSRGLIAQINPANITIARDSFGVPHIFAPTDAEVAYGLAWAHAEDDLNTIELLILTGKGKLAASIGKKGVGADYIIKLLRCREAVEEQWNTLSPDFLALIRGYIKGLNDYARAYPKRVKYRKSFPFDEKDYMTAVVLTISVFCGIDNALPMIMNGRAATIPGFSSQGSNAFAFHPTRTTTGEAFLTINAHQPLEGPTAFYEAHLNSEEGWNILGGLFPGGCLIFHGTNEHLGWAHTVNYQDKLDIFQLQMNPANNGQYKFDNEWMHLEVKKVKFKIKGIPVKVGRKVYWSKYGATVKTKQGVFSIRLPATMDIRALEQWYRMNKARNFSEFYKAVSMTSLPMFNIMYADRYDTIFYISNGKMPVRNPASQYQWRSTVPGNTSATLWTSFKPVRELPQYINPGSGFLYNTNHSPFLATEGRFNLNPQKYDRNDGYELTHNNRSKRITELMRGIGKIDYEGMKKIKFDQSLPQVLQYPYGIDTMFSLDTMGRSSLAPLINTFRKWDRKGSADSKGAAIFLIAYHYLSGKLTGAPRQITKAESIETFQYVHDYMIKYFGNTEVVLGDVQKIVRGDDARPSGGLPDVLTAAYSIPYENGRRKIRSGDAYVCFVRFPKDQLPIIETVNTFGASSDPKSPHFKDQFGMFLNKQTKPMTLDKQKVLEQAKKVYHPVK